MARATVGSYRRFGMEVFRGGGGFVDRVEVGIYWQGVTAMRLAGGGRTHCVMRNREIEPNSSKNTLDKTEEMSRWEKRRSERA
jgi:hypothetical protein